MTGLLVFGRTGQVAMELARLAPEARFLGSDEVDLMDPAACAAAIAAHAPSAVRAPRVQRGEDGFARSWHSVAHGSIVTSAIVSDMLTVIPVNTHLEPYP